MARETILVVDDENLIRWSMKQKLESWNFQVLEASSIQQAMARLQSDQPDLVTLDIKLPDGSGIDLLRKIREDLPQLPVVLITAFGAIDVAVQALKMGAYDFIEKPINFEKLENVVHNALEISALKTQVAQANKSIRSRFSIDNIIGKSKEIDEVLDLIRRLARAGASTLLVQGESGTGKELVSRALHYESGRRDKPFVALNCAAIPETLIETELFGYEKGAFTDAKTQKRGVFEMADGGTVFLDEISEMHLNLQSKFLRVLEDLTFRRVGGIKDITVDVQVVASTNRNLEQAVKEGKFREDLYYRLSMLPILIPPLRERNADIPMLVNHFIHRYNQQFRKNVKGAKPEALKMMIEYPWPGNVRELKNAIERAMILADGQYLEVGLLPIRISDPASNQNVVHAAGDHLVKLPRGGAGLEQIEKELIQQALEYANQNKTKAAKLLKISRDTLRYKVKKYELE